MEAVNGCFATLRPVSALTRRWLKSLEPLVLTVATKSLQRRNLAAKPRSTAIFLRGSIGGSSAVSARTVSEPRPPGSEPIVVRQRAGRDRGKLPSNYRLLARSSRRRSEAEWQRNEFGTA
jgi:hypothetical protein